MWEVNVCWGRRSIQACGKTQQEARHVGYKHARLVKNKGFEGSGARNKPCSGVEQTGVYRWYELHSAAIAAPELGADLMQSHDILAELQVIGKLIRACEVGEEVNDVLLLADEVLRELLTTSLELLLSSELDHLLALLGDVLC